MQATGIIVEYNPFHLGHLYHAEQSRKQTGADCIIAVMSGPFLQRGEPAIIDKWERTRAALTGAVDLVVELPHLFAVQHGDYFAKGAVETLNHLNVSSICFGSEEGHISPFLTAHRTWQERRSSFDRILTSHLDAGNSFPEASRRAYESIGIQDLDVSRPNNILGYSYVKAIAEYAPSIQPATIKRLKNDYHDEEMTGHISSATSIRKDLHHYHEITEDVKETLPASTIRTLADYKFHKGLWHSWEHYFPLIQYLLQVSSPEELREIHGMEEGLEYRILKAADCTSFKEMMETVKTKRYTWTRLQRLFVHLLTNIKKKESYILDSPVPYVRVLGMNEKGRKYLSIHKKNIEVPLLTQLKQLNHPLFDMDIRAQKAYLSPLSAVNRTEGVKRERMPPVMI
ncbi:nucleotidyltransferase [Salimicrobium halophilum]|uniref:tRNA(Met) cytidine acetate ligase n=1 Tax=Salimicrobium halophilum TaxID=86666 RepID=A0A1G8QGX1_9BACI|nr:nucleotidyltransferase [Salimicrobium halophilum]SDJ03846.1 Predicted nucleotidyltransferase [Salimicrobium halophilum]